MLGKDGETGAYETPGRDMPVVKEAERAIHTPAKDMSIRNGDLPSRWMEQKVNVLNQPKFGQTDYHIKRFALDEDGSRKALISFETIVYKDHVQASKMFVTTVRKLGPLYLSKLDIGDIAVMVEVKGHPTQDLKALIFLERNVMGLIMLSSSSNHRISDQWIVSMARLMLSRTK